MNTEEIEKMVRWIADYDFKYCGDSMCLELGGDGDNGEHLIYLLERYFEAKSCEDREIFAGT